MTQKMYLGFLAAGMAVAVVMAIGLAWAVVPVPSPGTVAASFVRALPRGRVAALSAPSLLRNPEFRGALAAWRSRDKTQRLQVQQGPVYTDTDETTLTSAKVSVVSHYAEIYPSGKALNWEQDYALTLTRGFLGPWRVSNVRTTAQAVVQALGGYRAQGQTNLVVPISIYLPQN